MNKPLLKAILSTLLGVSLLLCLVTGLGLFISSTGMVLGLPRYLVRNIHAVSALVMTGAALLHLALNMKTLIAEWRQGGKKRREK